MEINQSRTKAQPIWCYAQNQEKGKQTHRLFVCAQKVRNTLVVGSFPSGFLPINKYKYINFFLYISPYLMVLEKSRI